MHDALAAKWNALALKDQKLVFGFTGAPIRSKATLIAKLLDPKCTPSPNAVKAVGIRLLNEVNNSLQGRDAGSLNEGELLEAIGETQTYQDYRAAQAALDRITHSIGPTTEFTEAGAAALAPGADTDSDNDYEDDENDLSL